MRRIVLLLASMALTVLCVSGVTLADSPTTKEDCKKGGYAKYGFKNQGQCIKAVNHATPADTTAPQTTIDQIDTSELATNGSVVTHFSSSESNSTFECRMWPMNELGEEINIPIWEPCSSPKTYEDLGWYSYRFYVRATDAAGNVDETPAAQVFDAKVDTVNPNASITSGPADGETVTTDDVSFGWDASDRNLKTVGLGLHQHEQGSNIVPDHGSEWVYGVGPTVDPVNFSNLKNGTYTFSFTAEDMAGNQARVVRTFTVDTTLDTTPPEITLSGPEGITEDATPTYTYSANEPVTFKCLYELTPQGASNPSQSGSETPCPSPKTWVLNTDGKYVFSFEATDTAGNKATASKTLILDREPETRILAGPEGHYSNVVETDPQTGQQYHDVTYDLGVQGEASVSFECRLTPSGGTLSSDWTQCGNVPNDPLFTIERIPGDGETRTFDVRATDPGGRVDQTPASRSFTLPDSSP